MEFQKLFNEPANMAILKDFIEKIKTHKEEAFLFCLIVFSLSLGFGLGRLSKIKEAKIPISIETANINDGFDIKAEPKKENYSINKYVASKNGKKYYFSWCDGAKRISEKNIISFKSGEEAESMGYEKASNCPGL